MSLYRQLLMLMALTGATAVWAQPVELPDAPSGYSWAYAEETMSAFLVPDGWHYKKQLKPSGTWGYFISRENIDEAGEFRTGLTVNVVRDVPSKTGEPVADYANAFIREAAGANTVLKKPWRMSMGPFWQFGVRTRVSDPAGGDYVTHNLAIANQDTGTLYVIVFEGPAASWDSAWQQGEPMLKLFLLDSDI